MALNWRWDSKIGELTVRQIIKDESGNIESDNEFVKTLYEGNALLIMLNEWKDSTTGEGMYSMYSFFGDEEHAKNCLGLKKGHTNIFTDGITKVTKIRLNKTKSRNWKKIVTLFAQAFDEIIIELYSEDNTDGNNNT